MQYEPVIGLEVHVQLSTRSKIFCGCSTDYASRPPNTHVCPVCIGFPGVLPVLNEEVLRRAVKTVLAVGGEVQPFSKFDRKNYFYPDLPKAYQISQYDRPIGRGGAIEIDGESGERRRIGIHRIHMEEDAGKLVHAAGGQTLVDYNRAAVPLLEIVSEPEIRSPEEARAYLLKLKAILEYLEVSDCNMEEGSLRCDANVSVRPRGETRLGTKAEVKNLNSFKWVARALEHEIERQSRIVSEGGQVAQETRSYDPDSGVTRALRSKEEAHDYRYFPEPDLPPVNVGPEVVETIRRALPELPDAKRERYMRELGLSAYDAGVVTSEAALARYFEAAVAGVPAGAAGRARVEAVKNWITTELLGRLKAEQQPVSSCRVRPEHVRALVEAIESRSISGKIGKEVFGVMFETGADPAAIVKERGLAVITDRAALAGVVERVLAANPDTVAAIRKGKVAARQHLVGQVMRETRGKASPDLVHEILSEKLAS
jgi:aspartyl-tRNA(Asn)/glutamyl-tRNA(Gln) amidotransferase subunit B